MSEKRQHNAATMREKMLILYGENIHHKHNKSHLTDPPHRKFAWDGQDEKKVKKWSTKHLSNFKLRKTRKRLDKGHFH